MGSIDSEPKGAKVGQREKAISYTLVASAISVTDFAFGFQERQPLQGQNQADHVFAHPLGLGLRFGPYPAVDREPRMLQGEQPLGPLLAQHLPADKKSQDLPSEDLGPERS